MPRRGGPARCESCGETWPPGLSPVLKDTASRGCPACAPEHYRGADTHR